jgi:chromosome segregation ATPase
VTSPAKELEEMIGALRRQRDELRLQIHLAKAEAREEWEAVEKRWETVEARMPQLKKAATDSAKEVAAGLELVADEIGNAYKRLRDILK